MTWFRVEAALRDHKILGLIEEGLRVSRAEAAGLYILALAGFAEHEHSGRPELVHDSDLEDWAKWRGRRGRFAQLFRQHFIETREGQRDPPGQIKGWWRQAALFRKQQTDASRPAGNPTPIDPESPENPAIIPLGNVAGIRGGISGYGNGNGKKEKIVGQNGGHPTWLSPFSVLWTAGEPPYGQLARYLNPIVKKHGETEALRRWHIYLRSTDMAYWSAKRFAETWERWSEEPNPSGLADEPDFQWVD